MIPRQDRPLSFHADVFKAAVVLVGLVCLVGCSAEPRTYQSGFAKNPWRLTLNPDGTYVHAQHGSETDSGQWWEIQEHVIVLLPDDPAGTVQYAHVLDEPSFFGNYWLYPELRSALQTHSSVGPVVSAEKVEELLRLHGHTPEAGDELIEVGAGGPVD